LRLAGAVLASTLLFLAACGAMESLIRKPAEVPEGVDLSGNWLLRDTTGSTQRGARETLVHVFLETGKSVKVTQTASGLFVSFDRSVVEEYRFGEHREVSVGEISAERVSGWEGRAYVIETLDDNGAKLTDSYQLSNDGAVLSRRIAIWSRDSKQMSLAQVFDRI
jgi:hypothetical protein